VGCSGFFPVVADAFTVGFFLDTTWEGTRACTYFTTTLRFGFVESSMAKLNEIRENNQGKFKRPK
jgi:hypothetical protein